ncbi:hypothetical protein ABFP04_06070 [Acinetobacter towneri]|uniref:hypothetical protein n=1 Tax=Acinetobacter towneri TaxID=202956 RepID=UPI0032140654
MDALKLTFVRDLLPPPLFKEEVLRRDASASFIYSLKSGEKRVNVKKCESNILNFEGGKSNMDELIAKNPRLLKEYREKVAKKRYLKRKGKKRRLEDA